MEMSRLTQDGTAETVSRDQISGANVDREIFIFPVQLTTSRIGNLTRLILTLAILDDHTSVIAAFAVWGSFQNPLVTRLLPILCVTCFFALCLLYCTGSSRYCTAAVSILEEGSGENTKNKTTTCCVKYGNVYATVLLLFVRRRSVSQLPLRPYTPRHASSSQKAVVL